MYNNDYTYMYIKNNSAKMYSVISALWRLLLDKVKIILQNADFLVIQKQKVTN